MTRLHESQALSKAATDPARLEDEEARATLTMHAHRRFGHITAERIAAHVLAVTPEGDWTVRLAALEALARRRSFAERDGVRIDARPKGVLGVYRMGRVGKRRGSEGGYDTEILALDPIRTSCGCADFVRSALGVCKHGLVVLDALARSKRRPAPSAALTISGPHLRWDPIQPTATAVDRLARLRLDGALRGALARSFVRGAPSREVLASPASRLGLVEALRAAFGRGSLAAEPAVVTLLTEERANARRAVDCAAGQAAALASLRTLRRSLYPYQREGVRRFLANGRLLLADDMGLGKTTQAVACCHALFATQRVRRGILVVPAALKPQWKREWDATSDTPLTRVEGSPEERRQIYARLDRGFLILGYEQLLRDLEQIRALDVELVVLDEGQRIKNWATKSAQYVKALAPTYRLVLTGTPMENRLDELASIVDFVDDVALEPKWRLTPLHTIVEGDAGRGVAGMRNLTLLRSRLESISVRRLRAEVIGQLPSRTDTRVPVELCDAQRIEHATLDQPIAGLMRRAEQRPLTQPEFLRLMQLLTTQRMICNGLAQLRFDELWPRLANAEPSAHLLEELFAPKLAAFRALIEELVVAQGRKVVVFSQWRRMLRLAEWSVRDVLRRSGARAVFFTGAESSALRERAIVELHDEPNTRVMFLSDAGGVGLNLQRAASACVHLELPWNPAVLEQRVGRIHRLGQTLPIDVYALVSEEGIEARIAEIVERKRAMFTSLFDGTTDEVRFEGAGSFLSTVRALVEPSPPIPEGSDEGLDVGAAESDSDTPEIEARSAVSPNTAAPEIAAPRAPAGLTITRLEDGGLRIDAPPELAGALADAFTLLADALRRGASA